MNALTPAKPSPTPTGITSLMSPPLWRLASSNLDASTEIQDIVADPQLHAEAKALAPRLAARASGAGPAGVRAALAPLVLVYGVGEAAKQPAFWDAYDVLAGLPHEALDAGVKDYLAAPDSQFFPKPGPLKAMCDKHAEPIFKAAYRISRAASIEAPKRRIVSEQERAAVHRMAAEVAERLKDAGARAWPKRASPEDLPSIAGKADETGITPQMRELMAKRARA